MIRYSKVATKIDISSKEEWASVLRLAEQWLFVKVLDRAKVEMKRFKDAQDNKLVGLLASDRFPLSRAVKELGQDTATKLAMIHARVFEGGKGSIAWHILKALTSELGVDREIVESNKSYEALSQKYPAKVRFILRQPIQPWHPSSTLVHEAAAAVRMRAFQGSALARVKCQ